MNRFQKAKDFETKVKYMLIRNYNVIPCNTLSKAHYTQNKNV